METRCGKCGGDNLEVMAGNPKGAFVIYTCREYVFNEFFGKKVLCSATGIGVRQ